MKKHFVIFYSPGMLTAERTEKEINSWSVDKAIEISKTIKERHGALPYGFRFITKSRTSKELNSKITKRSNMYYLGGVVETLEEIKSKNNADDRILISNMECNGYDKIITNTNSYRWTQPFFEGDILLEI